MTWPEDKGDQVECLSAVMDGDEYVGVAGGWPYEKGGCRWWVVEVVVVAVAVSGCGSGDGGRVVLG